MRGNSKMIEKRNAILQLNATLPRQVNNKLKEILPLVVYGVDLNGMLVSAIEIFLVELLVVLHLNINSNDYNFNFKLSFS